MGEEKSIYKTNLVGKRQTKSKVDQARGDGHSAIEQTAFRVGICAELAFFDGIRRDRLPIVILPVQTDQVVYASLILSVQQN